MTKLTVRTLFATTLLLAMLCATNAQAIRMGSWNSDPDEDGRRSSNIISRIFDGRSWTPPERGEENRIDLRSLLASVRERIDGHRISEIIRIHISDIRPHTGGGLTPVPEPAAALLFAIGVGVVATRRRI